MPPPLLAFGTFNSKANPSITKDFSVYEALKIGYRCNVVYILALAEHFKTLCLTLQMMGSGRKTNTPKNELN